MKKIIINPTGIETASGYNGPKINAADPGNLFTFQPVDVQELVNHTIKKFEKPKH